MKQTTLLVGGLGANELLVILGIVAIGVGVVVAVIAIVMIASRKSKQRESQQTGSTRKCPFCAETIQSEAKICRYCGKTLEMPT